MKNKFETVQKFQEEMHDTRINKLIWISATHDKDVYDFLGDIPEEALSDVMPLISDYAVLSKYDCVQQLCDMGYYGFIAECHLPVPTDITFSDEGEISSFSSSHSLCIVFYAYGDTIELLTEHIEKQADIEFNEEVERYKKNHVQD